MKQVLTCGLPDDRIVVLQNRLPGLAVRAVLPGAIGASLQERPADLAIVSDALPGSSLFDVLAALRAEPATARLPVLVVLAPETGRDAIVTLVTRFQVSQMLFRPLDTEELLRQVAGVLDLPMPKERFSELQQELQRSMAAIWERFKDATLKRVGVLETATAALLAGRLEDSLRHEAAREAHKLKGSLGTFGFAEAARLADQIDGMLVPGAPLGASEALLLSEKLVALRAELEQAPALASAEKPVSIGGPPHVLVISADGALGDRLLEAARARGLQLGRVDTLEQARAALAARKPEAVLLELGGTAGDGRLMLAELAARHAGLPVLVLTGRDALIDRVEIARLGAARFLQQPMPESEVIDAVWQVLEQRRGANASILAVDDDPSVLEAIRTLLTPRGLKVAVERDPLNFWKALEAAQPDLLLLDVDMPYLSGIELCRVVRNDERWGDLPILFLTAQAGAETVQRVYAAGADDFLSKPLVAPELLTRLYNRLERSRLMRELAGTDPLTGLLGRPEAARMLTHAVRLAVRFKQPFAFALLEIAVPAAGEGDRAIKQLAGALGAIAQPGDVVARWAPNLLAIGAFAMPAADLAGRLEHLLAESAWPGGAGVATSETDGQEFLALWLAADQALARARQAGERQARLAGR